MKIKPKLWLGLSSKPLIIILLIVVGILQVVGLNKLSTQTKENFEISRLAEHIRMEVKDEAISLRNYVIFEDPEAVQAELSNLQKASRSIDQKISLLQSKITTPQQSQLVEKLIETNNEFNSYSDKVIDYKSSGNKAEAIAFISEKSDSLHQRFFEIVSKMTEEYEKDMVSSFTSTTESYKTLNLISSLICIISVIISSGFVFSTVLTFAKRLSNVSQVMLKVATGEADLTTRVEMKANDEIDDVAKSFNTMVESLEEQKKKEQDLIWVKSNVAEITTAITGIHNLEKFAETFLSKVVPLLQSSHAVFYGKEIHSTGGSETLRLLASYAMADNGQYPVHFRPGEGLIGQAAIQKSPIILEDIPAGYVRVKSGLGETKPLQLYVLPVIFEDDVKAVIEFALLKPLNVNQQILLNELLTSLGIIFASAISRVQLAHLLEESQTMMEEIQAQSEELQAQQEELRVTNEELEEQTLALKQSEQVLHTQREELEQTNLELKEKAALLEQQNRMFEQTNREVELAHTELEEKAKQLELSSKYKSEFLANMSHELRTPLNSLLILSKLLADNQEGNLSEKQVKFANTINSSGSDLLLLINDILDLAKIESGKMDVNLGKVFFSDIVEFAESSFRPVANEKGLSFTISLAEGLPASFTSDEQRLQQILQNLLSNAFKFTHKGGVTLEIGRASYSTGLDVFSFSVRDSGIGISLDKQELIFEAFQQADGTTSRRYGGSGLGLSICREIASMLNGQIDVESAEGKGSTFIFTIGEYEGQDQGQNMPQSFAEVAVTEEIEDVQPEVIQAASALQMPKQQEISVIDADIEEYEIKRLLLLDYDVRQRTSLMELIGEKNVIIKTVSSGSEALEELKINTYELMVLDIELPDYDGIDLLEKISSMPGNESLNLFIYTARDLTSKEEVQIKKYTNTIIIKNGQSPQRLMDELDYYLHALNPSVGTMNRVKASAISTQGLKGKRLLLVDDDVRNVYALMSFLEQYNMDITFAENGRESLDILENSPAFDLILMDIMMPEMDGYEAIRRIKSDSRFSSIPIIALTAKAMKEDRERCIASGASDYIVKPFDVNQLVSLIKVWLYRQ